MRIRELSMSRRNGRVELSAVVDGDPVWFRFPDSQDIELRIEPFLCVSFIEAMVRAEPIEVQPGFPVCDEFREGLRAVQRIFHGWNSELAVVELEADSAPVPASRPGASTMFSGGVDSMATLLRHKEEITHGIFLEGYGYESAERDVTGCVERNRAFLERQGVELIHVQSNARRWNDQRKISWPAAHGPVLIGISLAAGFQKAYIPSSHTYIELYPWGSHLLTDPLLGTARTRVVHEGADLWRTQKMKLIAKSQDALDSLNVCWIDVGRNCGKCPKCLRTMVALRLLGRTSTALPELEPKALRGVRIGTESGLNYVVDNIQLAREKGDKEIEKPLQRAANSFRRKQLIAHIDRDLLGGVLRRIHRWRSKHEWHSYRGTLRPR